MERATHPRRRVATLFLALLAALAVALSAVAGPVAAKPAKTPPGLSKAAGGRTATVMTRNLYLGAELDSILIAFAGGDDEAIVEAASTTWGQVRASYPAERMAAIADEIVAEKPHAVGLQEVTRYTTVRYPGPSGGGPDEVVVEYDMLQLLLEALADRGVTYREVPGATAENFSTAPIPPLGAIPVVDPAYPMPAGQAAPNRAVALLDRDVIIVRAGVKATNARNGQFRTIITSPLPIQRGWGSADLTAGKARFRFVNSHTEAFGPTPEDAEAMRVAQVAELFAAEAGIRPRRKGWARIYAGDFNSRAPSAAAYQALLAGGLHDLWVEARPGSTGEESNTCCQDALLRTEGPWYSRIDLLLGSDRVRALSSDRLGDTPLGLPGGVRWASDHAGVVATVKVK